MVDSVAAMTALSAPPVGGIVGAPPEGDPLPLALFIPSCITFRSTFFQPASDSPKVVGATIAMDVRVTLECRGLFA